MTSSVYAKKQLTLKSVKRLAEKLHRERKRIVLTYGTYDLIHSAHAAYLIQARAQGDVLIVAVASNQSVRQLKGKGFPLIDQKNRAELLHYFDFVDYTVFADKRNMSSVIRALQPDVFYTLAEDWKSHLRKKEEEDAMKKNGGKIVKTKKQQPYVSASGIVELVADIKIKEVMEYFFGKIQIDLTQGHWNQKKWSGLKTKLRTEALSFGNHADRLGLFSKHYFGQLVKRDAVKKLGEQLRAQGKKVVFSAGSCDLVHAGHARFYAQAKALGDVLVLAIPSNHIIRRQKGRGRPIIDEYSRAELMGFFHFVDYLVIFDDASVLPILEDLQPDIFFTVKEEWNTIGKEEKHELSDHWQGKVVSVPPQAGGLSSSKIIRKAAGIRIRQVFKEVLQEAEKWTSLKD